MEHFKNHADDRLVNGCIYCGGPADTRDHVPSRCLLDRPFPANLPVVGCCDPCNQEFSKDEEYFVCLLESVLCGSADPEQIKRPSVARILHSSPTLRARLETVRRGQDGQIVFIPEAERIANVMLKLARGHAAFELSQPCRENPDHFWCGPLASLSKEQRESFDSVHVQQIFGEIGSRNIQRMLVTQMSIRMESGEQKQIEMLINDWVDVQDERYRYLAIDDVDGIVIRIVVSEFLACEVAWRLSAA